VRLDELPAQRPLGEVAGDRDKIGVGSANGVNQRRQQALVEPAKVQIGKMNESTHCLVARPEPYCCTLGGAITWSAPGMVR
jgi:hypothetical protein